MNDAQMEITYTLDDLPSVARQVLGRYSNKRIWLFYGEIGTGKTTFIKALCDILQVEDATQSPSFSLVNLYFGTLDNIPIDIYHIDLYRIEDLDEAIGIGIDDYLQEKGYSFIEWPQIIEPILPPNTIKLFIEIVDQTSRKVLIL